MGYSVYFSYSELVLCVVAVELTNVFVLFCRQFNEMLKQQEKVLSSSAGGGVGGSATSAFTQVLPPFHGPVIRPRNMSSPIPMQMSRPLSPGELS